MYVNLIQISECLRQFPFVREGWLFGSFAYGIPHMDSDIDLCVVVDNGSYNNFNYGNVRFEVSRAIGFSRDMDLIMLEKKRVTEQSIRKDLVFYDVFHKGKQFYTAEGMQ